MARPVTNKGILRDIAKKTNPSMFLDYRLFLIKIYEQACNLLPNYNYRKYSADLGFGESTQIHQIVRGYRPLTEKSAIVICDALYIRNEERRFFLNLVRYSNSARVEEKEKYFSALVEAKSQTLPSVMEKAVLEYLTEWYNPVVRELCTGTETTINASNVAKLLEPSIRPEQAKKCLALLENLGLIEIDPETGNCRATSQHISTGHRVKGVGVTRYHQQLIELGKESLTRFAGDERDVTALTLRATPEEFEQMREIIRQTMREIQAKIERPDRVTRGERVYQVNIQVFPLTAALSKKDDQK